MSPHRIRDVNMSCNRQTKSQMNAEINKALQHADVRAKLLAQGADIHGGTPAQYGAYIRKEWPRWAQAVKDSGAKAD